MGGKPLFSAKAIGMASSASVIVSKRRRGEGEKGEMKGIPAKALTAYCSTEAIWSAFLEIASDIEISADPPP
jgi:hypothetical protein